MKPTEMIRDEAEWHNRKASDCYYEGNHRDEDHHRRTAQLLELLARIGESEHVERSTPEHYSVWIVDTDWWFLSPPTPASKEKT